jgi:hypothetical protein
MSRATSKPSSSQVRNRAQTRSSDARSDFQNIRRTSQKPSAANRTELRNQVNRYAKDKPRQKVDRKDHDQRIQNFSKNRENQVIQNRQVSDRVSKRLHQSHHHYNQWFDRNFFDHHHLDLDYLGTRANWWRPAAWGTLASWGAWQWSTPYYYDETGYYYPVTVEPTYVYPRTTIVYPYSTTTTPSQPVQPSSAEITEIPATSEEEWLPLGVFAVISNAVNATEETNLFIQLAINREGEIAGVLYNSETGDAQDITGTVNTKSQKAYWLMADQEDSPIASTGIYNLTEDQTPINVHFSDGSEQTWTLVRIKQEQ